MGNKASIKNVKALLEYARQTPEGFFLPDALIALGIPATLTGNKKFYKIVHDLRSGLAETEYNLVCDKEPGESYRRYRLASTLDRMEDPNASWEKWSMKHIDTRVETMANVAESLVLATNSRSTEGKKARLAAKYLGRLREDLVEIEQAQ